MLRAIVDTMRTEQRHDERVGVSVLANRACLSARQPRRWRPRHAGWRHRHGVGRIPAERRRLHATTSTCRQTCSPPRSCPTLRHSPAISSMTPSSRRTRDALAEEIRAGIEKHAVVQHPRFGRIYAYETDGLGNHLLMDDANVPSLLSIPYLGYLAADDPAYLATRAFVLSGENPYFFEGRAGDRGRQPAHAAPAGLADRHLDAGADRDGSRRGRTAARARWRRPRPERDSCTSRSTSTIPRASADRGSAGRTASSPRRCCDGSRERRRRPVPARHQLLAAAQGDVLVGGLRRRRGARGVRDDPRRSASRHVRFFLLWESFQPTPDTVDATALPRPADGLRHRGRDGAEAPADVLHRPHVRPELGAGLAARCAHAAPDGRAAARQPRGGRTGSPTTIHNTYTEPFVIEAEDLQLRTVCGEPERSPGRLGLQPGQRAGPVLPARPTPMPAGSGCATGCARSRTADPNHPALIGLHSASRRRRRRPARRPRRRGDRRVGHARLLDLPPAGPQAARPGLRPVHRGADGRPRGPAGAVRGVRRQHAAGPDGPSHWSGAPPWDGGTRAGVLRLRGRRGRRTTPACCRGCIGSAARRLRLVLPRLPPRPCGTARRATSRRTSASSASGAPDGSLKPMGKVVRDFAASEPLVRRPEQPFVLPMSPDDFYADPERHLPTLFARFLAT